MKTLKATTARILLLCLIFIEQNVAEPAARHNVVSHHQDTARRHHAPSGIQAPHKLAPSSSKVYCISADSNIYEILHKANAYCRGNDFKCTFYHYSDHKYHNLGTIDVNKELFDKLLAKYENWLMTSEPIDENNGKDSNHKVKLKGSGNKLYSTYIIDDKTQDKANRNGYDCNVMQDPTKLDKHYRRHKAKLTGDQKTRYINGERVSVDPKFNKQQKYYEVFLPKDKHRGDPRTIYVDIDGDKENTDKEHNNDLNDRPIKVQLNEYSSNDEGKIVIHDKHNRKDVYRQHSNNKIARTEDIEETNKFQSPVALNTKLGDNDKMLSNVDDTDNDNTEDDDDKLHRIHLVETNKHHNDLSADNFTYKRTNTVQLNEPVFHVENPRNRNNMHIFSLPDYTGHHSDIISDYTGYKDIHLLPNLPDDEEVPSLPSTYDISLSEATEKESPTTLYTNPDLQRTNDNLLPGHIKYYNPKVTHGSPFSSQSGSSPIVSSSSETAAIPKYSPFDIALRSSPYSGVSETLTPCDLKTLSQATISSSPSTVLSNEDKYKINLLSSPFEPTKSFADSHLFKKLPPVNPETTYFSQPSDVTMPIDATSFLNNLPKSFESVASYVPTATMPSPLNSKLGPEICQFPQVPYSSPYSQFSPPNLGLLNQLQQNNNFAKPMFNQNNMFSQPSRDLFDIKINPFITRPQFSYSYAEPINPMASYLSSSGSVINSSPSAYTNSILNGNRLPGTVSNSFLYPSPANQMSPLNLRQQRPNNYSPPCPNPASMTPYNNISPLDLENYHQFTDNLGLNANVGVQDSLSPIQNTPLSVLDHPYRTTPSNYIRPTQANIFSTSAPSQDKPIILSALENQLLESQGETSSYSKLAHITEKPCLNLQNEPLVTFDASLLGNHLFELSNTKPIVSNTDVNINVSSIDSEVNELTPIDFSLVNPDSDTIHIQLNTTINLNQEPQPGDILNLSQDSNLLLDSTLTKLDEDTSPCTAVDNNKPSINVTTTLNIESEQMQNNEAVISEFDSSLIGTGLSIPSDDSIVTENVTEDSSSTDFIPLEQSDKNVERELNQTVNIKQESNQTGIEYSDKDESILLPNLTEQELKVDVGIADLQHLDSTLIDLESDNITETVAQEFETVDGLPNVNVTVCEPDVNLSVQTNIDLKTEAENPQLLENPPGSTIDITINTSVNITDNYLEVLEPELVETKPNEKSIITNEGTEFIPLDETIHTKDKETINEFEAGEFIPALTSGMNIPAEDITAEILPNNELNSSLVGPNLDELKEEPGIASTELDFTADLIGPTMFDINETLNDVPSKVVDIDSSLIKPISGIPTMPPCKEPFEVLGQSDTENLLHSGAVKESDILLSSNPLTFENSLIGPSLINDTTGLETPPPEKFQEILPTSETPTINFESNLLGPNLLPHNNIKDSFENIESSLVGPGLEQVINAPEDISNLDAKLNFSSSLIGPNLIIDANEPDLLRKLEAGTKIDAGKPGPTIVDGKPLVEESVPYSEYQIDASLIGPHLNNNIIAKTNEVKPKFDQTNSVILDSSLIDNLLDSEKSINGPNGPSIVSSANSLSSDLKREGLPLEADISLICLNPAVKPKYEELPSPPPFVPKISFSHDLIGPGLSNLHPETSLPSPYIPQEGTPKVSNGFLEELKPTTYSKLSDLYLPATPFINAAQHSLPCDNLFIPSSLPSSLLNNRLPASVLNLPSNILSDHQSPLYANTIPSSFLSPSSKYSPLHNLPHTPFSSPYLKPEYLQSVKNPLVLNAFLNNPHLKDAISYYSPIQPPEPFEQIGLPRLPNFQDLPNKYLKSLNGIPFNMQPLKSTIPFAPQTKTPLSSTEINWQEVESLPIEVQNTPVKPGFKPVKNQAPYPNIYSPLQIKESDSLFASDHQNYHMIESELNKFIYEAKNDNKLQNHEIFEAPFIPPCEKVKYLQGNNVEKYISEASTFVDPLKVAKEQLNLKETEFIKLEPELHYPTNDAMYLPRNPPPKYKPKVQDQVCYQPLNEADILKDYQLLETPVNTPIVKPSVSQKTMPKKPSTDQFYPYEMLPEPLALPVKPSSSPASYAKAQISPLLPPPCLQEYTSVPASEYLPTSNLRPMPSPIPSRPSKTYDSPYLPEYSSPSYIDTYNIPIEASKPASPCKPSESYASSYLPTHSNTPLFETGVPIESPNLPIAALPKELPILPAPLKPISSTPLTPTEFMSPTYYNPSSTTYTDSPFMNPANILTEPLSSLSATSDLPCLKPFPEANPIFRELMQNPQFMKAMNLPMANNNFPWNTASRKPNPFMLQTPNYLPYEPQTPNYLPYEPTLINMENFKKNKLFSTAIESNLQKLKDAYTELWTTYDETYSNDSGTKIHENIVPESHLKTVPCTLDSEKYTNLGVNKDLTPIPIETLNYATELSKPQAIQGLPIKMYSSKKNELSTPILELNSQKLETAPSEVWTAYDEKSNYNTNDSGTKIHEGIVPERHLETVPYSIESEENLKVNEAPISNYATESNLNHGRPISYNQVKEAEYYKPIQKVPQASDMQWLPLSCTEYSPNSLSGVSKPCPKLSPFKSSFNKSPYLQALPHYPSFLPSMKGFPCKNKLDSLPYSSSPYYPAITEEYSELPTTAPFRNYTPLLPIKSVLENFVPIEGIPYLPSDVSSPYTRLPSPASYLPSYQSNITPLPGLQLTQPTAEQLRNISPITEGPSPIEYTPVQSPIHTSLPTKSMKPIPCPSSTSALPIQNDLPLPEASISYESYEQPGFNYPPAYQNIIEHLPTPVPLKESPVYYEPASSPRLIKSPNIIESLPFTMSLSSEDVKRLASDNLSPINDASYTSPIEEYLEASSSLPCRPLMKPISPQPKLYLPEDEYTILPSSSEATPFETYSSYETKPYVPDISKPRPKPKSDAARYLPVDVSPYQITDQPYTPVNKGQTPSSFEYISESSPLLKQLLAPPFKGYNSLPFGSNVKLPYLPPTYMPLDKINTLPPTLINPFIKSELKEIPAPLSVPTNIITSTPKESSTASDMSSLDNYEEYIEPCPLPKPLQSSSLIKPLMTPIKALPELMKEEIPIELENVFTASANIPQYISPNNSLLKQLIGNAYNSPLFLPQNNKQKAVPSEIDNTKLSTHVPIICNIDETSSPITPIVSELPDIKPCDFKAPSFNPHQSLPIEKISPITMTPLSTTKSPLLTSSYQEIYPTELAETLPVSSVRPTSSSVFSPPHRPSKFNPISMKYGPKSIVEYLPDINNICPSEIPSCMEPAMVESTQYAPKTKNIKQIHLDGFPIAELFAEAPKILPYNPLSKIEIPKKSEHQNIPKDSSDWVLLNNDYMADKTNAKLTPYEYTQTTENPAEAEYLKLAKLLETKKPKTEFEKYLELIEANQYIALPSKLLDDNVCKNVYKPEHIGINLHLPQKSQNSATFDNFYANNHIGPSPLICLIDPRRESKYPTKPLVTSKPSYNEINPDITYLEENLSGNINSATDSDYNFITPSENLRSTPATPIEGSPISIDSKYLDKPTFKSPKIINGPNPVEYFPENQYYYPPKDNIDDIKYSGYKTYQLPTQKLAEKSSNIPLETYYPTVPFSTPKSSIPNSYMSTISPETYIPEYETLELPVQAKSDLRVQPQSPIYNNYYPTNEVTVKPYNLDKNDEIKNCIINYINSKGLKDKLYTNNEEITIPIGDIAITKKEPHTAKVLQTNNPSIGLKVWQSNVKIVKAELKFKTNEVSVNNFMPLLNNLNEYDIQEIRKIIKKYIDDKYGNHIEVNEPYTIDNQYTVIKDLNRNENEKYNLLWPTYYV